MKLGSKDGSDACINLVFMKPEHLLSGDVPLPPEQRGWQEPPCKEIHQGGDDDDGRSLGEDVASCHRNLPHHVI